MQIERDGRVKGTKIPSRENCSLPLFVIPQKKLNEAKNRACDCTIRSMQENFSRVIVNCAMQSNRWRDDQQVVRRLTGGSAINRWFYMSRFWIVSLMRGQWYTINLSVNISWGEKKTGQTRYLRTRNIIKKIIYITIIRYNNFIIMEIGRLKEKETWSISISKRIMIIVWDIYCRSKLVAIKNIYNSQSSSKRKIDKIIKIMIKFKNYTKNSITQIVIPKRNDSLKGRIKYTNVKRNLSKRNYSCI